MEITLLITAALKFYSVAFLKHKLHHKGRDDHGALTLYIEDKQAGEKGNDSWLHSCVCRQVLAHTPLSSFSLDSDGSTQRISLFYTLSNTNTVMKCSMTRWFHFTVWLSVFPLLPFSYKEPVSQNYSHFLSRGFGSENHSTEWLLSNIASMKKGGLWGNSFN